MLTVRPEKAVRLRRETEAVLKRDGASPREIESILGRWTWAVLLRRCLLSIMGELYTLANMQSPNFVRKVSKAQVVELNMLLDLFPAMYADLQYKDSGRVYASDASLSGRGVPYCDMEPQELKPFLGATAETRVRKGWYSTLAARDHLDSFQHTANEPQPTGICVSPAFKLAVDEATFRTAIATHWRVKGQQINT